jgi:hypothetical protein
VLLSWFLNKHLLLKKKGHYFLGIPHKQRYFTGQIHHFVCQVPPNLLLDDSVGRIARKLWWTNQEISLVNIIPPWFSMLIYHLGDEQ